MNRNKKEKYARIEIRVKPKDKERIRQIANKCGLTVSEYVLQRAFRATIVRCPNYHSKRSVKIAPKSDKFSDSS